MGKLKVSGKCSLASILHSLSNKGFVPAMWSALQEASTPEKLRQYSGHGYIRFLPKDIFRFCHFYHSMSPCFFISSFKSGCEATTYQIPASFKIITVLVNWFTGCPKNQHDLGRDLGLLKGCRRDEAEGGEELN